MLNFGDLTKRVVHIGIDNEGHWIEVPMLTVADFDEFNKIQRGFVALKEKSAPNGEIIDAIIEARRALAEMACKVMPQNFHDGLRRAKYPRLAELVRVLCTGDDESDADDPQKKIPLEQR